MFENLRIAVVTYAGYPVRYFSDDRFEYFLEGRIYNLSDQQEEQRIKEIPKVFQGNCIPGDRLYALLNSDDAEFFLCIVDRLSRQWMLVGDSLSRLPVYSCQNKNWALYLRDLAIKRALIPDEPDQVGVAETLYFGYPLSDRTIYRYTHRLMPAFYILEDIHGRKTGTWKQYNFENYHTERDPRIIAGKARELFLNACTLRLRSYEERKLSLSGGLDSRVIGSALRTLKLTFRIDSYLDPWNNALQDLQVAKKIADTWEKKLNVVEIKRSSGEFEDMLIKMKSGMNSLGMSFILEFFTRISGPGMVYITGDGGDKVLPDLTWDMQGKNVYQLASFILKKHIIIVPEIVAKDTRTEMIRNSLVELLEASPEKSMEGKYIRFLIMGRGVKWLFEGEDRNRCFFPSITPYYSTPLFDYLMAIDPAVKKNYQLYHRFISVVSPETLRIDNANWNFPIDQTTRIRFLLFKQRVKYSLPGWALNVAEKKDHQEYVFILKTLSKVFGDRFDPNQSPLLVSK
ncbi:MAG: hypothetical protein D4R67_05005 [Bacteroidetes bacterium]|nr:MAG: hypothetical protein D4R67_05005 [Bacteroidota bacterium]